MTATIHSADEAPDDEVPHLHADDPPATSSVTRQGVREIARFVRMHPAPFVWSLVGGTVWSFMVVGAAFLLGVITDRVIEPAFTTGVTASAVVWSVVALFLVGTVRGLSVVVRRWFGSVTETRMQRSLRSAVVDRLLTMPMSSYRRRPTGELLANADIDVTTATQMLMPLPFSLGVIVLIVISLVSLVVADGVFGLVAMMLFPAMAILSRRYTERVHEPAALVQAKLGNVSAIAHESFDGALVVKTLGLEQAEQTRFESAAADLRDEAMGVARMTASFQPVIDLLPSLGIVLLLLGGAWRIDTGDATPGELVSAVALFGWLAFPMRIVGFLFESIPRAVVSLRRVDALLAEPADDSAEGSGDARTDARLPDGPVGLRLDGVGFAYGDNPVLTSVSFDVDPGEVVAIVGSIGSGKTTLVHLLSRLDDPDSGVIELGDVPITELDPDELRATLSLVGQETYLFADSVESNVRLDRDISDEAVVEALDRARAARFVDRLPRGWHTVVGERGVTLSGGQRQRVSLARALAGRPRVLVLDDATSAVDPVVEAEILQGLRREGTTMLVVAHRLSTIELADRVVFLVDGSVRAQGAHNELLADPDYAALVSAYEDDDDFDVDVDGDSDGDSDSDGESGDPGRTTGEAG